MEKRIATELLLLGALFLSSCASGGGSPFPSTFMMTAPNMFKFVASGTWTYPANSQSAERRRLDWLHTYVDKNNICPGEIEIITRFEDHVSRSPKSSTDAQSLQPITYYGRCQIANP